METRYYLIWRNKSLTDEAEDLEDMIAALEQAADTLREMHEVGVWLEGSPGQDFAYLVTDDLEVAFEYGFEEEEEGEDQDEGYNDDDDEFYAEYEEEGEGDYYGEDEDYEKYNDEDYAPR